MSTDYLSHLPVDLFIKEITYLSFDEVINVCQTNKTLHNYCTNYKYNNNWKALIDNTFRDIYSYDNYLKEIRNKLNISDGIYNYLVYSHLVKVLDPITQLMIYYRQDDMDSFDSPEYTNTQNFLALFLLGNVNVMRKYVPSDAYLPFISMLDGDKIDQNILNKMLGEMAKEGSVKGVSMMLSKGANIHVENDWAMRWASKDGHLEVVKYLIEHGADIHAQGDDALISASQNGHLEVVKYLMENGADVHAHDDQAVRWASSSGYLDVVKYLVEHGADIHAWSYWALTWASEKGHLDVVKYLVENGADIHIHNDYPLRWASKEGHLEVVKYLVEHGAYIHADDDDALKLARAWGHLKVVKY